MSFWAILFLLMVAYFKKSINETTIVLKHCIVIACHSFEEIDAKKMKIVSLNVCEDKFIIPLMLVEHGIM